MAINIDHTKHLISPNASTTIRFDTTGSIVIPVGNQSQRPGTALAGALRFNTQANGGTGGVEYYDGSAWNAFLSDATLNSFSTISVAGQDNLVSDSSTDTLTFAEGTGITITTDATSDTLTITLDAGIDDLTDVDTSSTAPTSGQALLWNSTTSKWEPGNVSVANALDDLTDVVLTSPTADQVLKYDGTNWVNTTISIEELDNVDIASTPTDGYVLKYNASTSKWQPAADTAGIGGVIVTEVDAGGDVETFSNVTEIKFDADSGFDVVNLGAGQVKISMNSTFKYWEVDGQDTLVATGLDTIKFVPGTGLVITTDITSDPKEIGFALDADLDNLNDVVITAPTAGQVLKYDGTNWVNDTDNTGGGGGASALDDLTDVDTAGVTNGQVLKYNSSQNKWLPANDLTSSSGTGTTGTLLDELTPDGVTETFDLTLTGDSYTPQSSENLIVTINGVFQVPYQAYEVIGDQITFAEPLATDDLVCIVEMAGGTTGGGGISSITLKENGTAIGTATALNFIGADVTVGSGTGTITITGAGVNSNLYRYSIASATSTLTGPDDNTVTLEYIVDEVAVYLNGIRLQDGADYTATDGTSLVFSTPLSIGDYVEVEAYNPGGGGGGGASAIDDLTDVRTTGAYSPADGQALVWNASASQWEPGTVSGGGGSVDLTRYQYTIASTTSTISGADDNANTLSYSSDNLNVYLNGIRLSYGNDYTATSGSSVVLAVSVGSGNYVEIETWTPSGGGGGGGGASAIDDLTDVVITTPSSGQVLKYDGTNWINDTDNSGGNLGYLFVDNFTLVADETGDFLSLGQGDDHIRLGTIDEKNIYLTTNYGTTGGVYGSPQVGSFTWTFGGDGNLTFPDGSVQTTAYTGGLHSADTTVYFTTTTTVDTFDKTVYRSAKYLLQATTGTDYHVTEIVLIHDDTDVYISEYGTTYTNTSLIAVTADISGTDVRLRVTPVGAPTSVKLKRIDIEV